MSDGRTNTPGQASGNGKRTLCKHCNGELCLLLGEQPLNPDGTFAFGNRAKPKRRLYTTAVDALGWAQAGCPLAMFIIEKVVGDNDIRDSGLIIALKDWRSWDGSLLGNFQKVDFLVIAKRFSEGDIKDRDGEKTILRYSAEVFTDPDDPLSSRIFGRPVSQELGSRENLDLARNWISKCIQGEHRCCQPTTKSILPSRLLRVWHDYIAGSDAVRLHVSTPDQKGEYLTLSYCWGAEQTFITTTTNFSSMVNAIALQDMPKTFRDAVHIAKELGYLYIWIDALCIIQDSEIDKTKEISQMHDIYRNATFTISADRSADCRNGFLGPVRIDAEQTPEIVSGKIPCHTIEGGVGFIRLRKLIVCDPTIRQPIHKRCWTYQEQFLSTRVLSFGDQMSWKCASGDYLSFGTPSGTTPAKSHRHMEQIYMPAGSANLLTMPRFRLQDIEHTMWSVGFDWIGWIFDELFREAEEFLAGDAVVASVKIEEIHKNEDTSDSKSKKTKYWTRKSEDNVWKFKKFRHKLAQDPIVLSAITDRKARNQMNEAIGQKDLLTIAETCSAAIIRIVEIGIEVITSHLAEGAEGHDTFMVLKPVIDEVCLALQVAVDVKDAPAILTTLVIGAMQALSAMLREHLRSKSLTIHHSIYEPSVTESTNSEALIEGHQAPEDEGWEPFYDDLEAWLIEWKATEGLNLPDLIKSIISPIARYLVNEIHPNLVKTHWPLVVEQYSQRSLTIADDRLRAFSGIAREFSDVMEGRYLAGLWEGNVLKELMWHEENVFTTRAQSAKNLKVAKYHHTPDLRPFIAPSWSWAATDNPIKFVPRTPKVRRSRHIPKKIKYLECSMTYADPEDLFGDVMSGTLTLSAPLKKVSHKWFTRSFTGHKEIYPDSHTALAFMLEIQCKLSGHSGLNLWLLELSRHDYQPGWHTYFLLQGLVLEWVRENIFRRVGYFKRVYKKSTFFSLFKISSIDMWWDTRQLQVKTIRII